MIPVGLWGTEAVWPRSSKVPLVWNVLHPPPVQVRAGPAVGLGHHDPEADTATLLTAIRDLLPAEARTRRTPTADEVRRATP